MQTDDRNDLQLVHTYPHPHLQQPPSPFTQHNIGNSLPLPLSTHLRDTNAALSPLSISPIYSLPLTCAMLRVSVASRTLGVQGGVISRLSRAAQSMQAKKGCDLICTRASCGGGGAWAECVMHSEVGRQKRATLQLLAHLSRK